MLFPCSLFAGDTELNHINDAISMFSMGSCLRFQELNVDDSSEEQHLLFTKTRSLGWAFPHKKFLCFTCNHNQVRACFVASHWVAPVDVCLLEALVSCRCFSYVGRADPDYHGIVPQPIFLSFNCFSTVSTVKNKSPSSKQQVQN